MKLFTRFLERYSRFDEGREKEESNDGLTFEGKEIKGSYVVLLLLSVARSKSCLE